MASCTYTVLAPLKIDIFGKIELARTDNGTRVTIRNWGYSKPMVRPIAHHLALREKRTLILLNQLKEDHIPRLLYFGKGLLVRSYIEGSSLKEARTRNAGYYEAALDLLSRIHAQGVVHNDLEKPENWIVTEKGNPAVVDFQIACYFPEKGPLFRMAAKEDIRHLVKQKARFCPENLSEEEKQLLKDKSMFAQAWDRSIKPIYNFVTRKILRYSDRRHSKYSR